MGRDTPAGSVDPIPTYQVHFRNDRGAQVVQADEVRRERGRSCSAAPSGDLDAALDAPPFHRVRGGGRAEAAVDGEAMVSPGGVPGGADHPWRGRYAARRASTSGRWTPENDAPDAADLADLLRMGRLPEAWLAPPQVRDLRELVRHRHKLRGMCTAIRLQTRAALARCETTIPARDLFSPTGRRQLDGLALPPTIRVRVDSQLRLIEALEAEIDAFDRRLAARLGKDSGFQALQSIPGIGPGARRSVARQDRDVSRFPSPRHLCSGLTPRHRESDTKVHRGRITKQGSRLVRWACIEAWHAPAGTPMPAAVQRITTRRGTPASSPPGSRARSLLTLAYYALRDGHVRRLDRATA